MSRLLALLGATLDPSHITSGSAAWLYADHLACAGADPAAQGDAGPYELAVERAIAGHRLDLDDLHWQSMTHAGSIIWPVCDAVGRSHPGRTVLIAAARGYETIARLALGLRQCGVRSGHLTAIAGAAGAAAAAASFLDDHRTVATAIGLAVSVAGGVGQSMIDRVSAPAFHRAASATVGIAAAHAASSGIVPSEVALDGRAGLIALLGGDPTAWNPEFLDPAGVLAMDQTAVRIYPVHGFAQAVVHAVSRVAYDWPADADANLTVSVHSTVLDTLPDGPDPWWSVQAAATAAWRTRSPWIAEAHTRDGACSVRIAVDDRLPIGACTVSVSGGSQYRTASCDVPFALPQSFPLEVFEKWRRLGVADPEALLAAASARLTAPSCGG